MTATMPSQALEALISSKLFDHLKLGIVLQNLDGEILVANSETKRLLGSALENGFSFQSSWRPVLEDGSEFMADSHPAAAVANGDHHPVELVIGFHPTPSDETRWFRISAFPLNLAGQEQSTLVCTTYQDITAQKALESALKKDQSDVNQLIASFNVPVVLLEPDLRIQTASPSFSNLCGVSLDELRGRDFIQFMPASERKKVKITLEALNLPTQTCRLLTGHGNANNLWLDWSFKVLQAPTGNAISIIGIADDITEKKRLEEKLRRTMMILQHTVDGVMLTDQDNRIISVNEPFTRITGYKAEEIIGLKPSVLMSGRHDQLFFQEMWSTIQNHGKWQGQVWNRRKNGEIYPQWLTIIAIKDRYGKPFQYVGIFAALLQASEDSKIVKQLVHIDPLTELPNRLLFTTYLEHAIQDALHNNKLLGLLYIDIDQFQNINDSLGYQTGDELLIEAARRMKAVLRSVDTLSRIGGDEFIILVENIAHVDDLANLAAQIKDSFSEPFLLRKQEIYLSASVGISIYPKDGQTIDKLIKNATAAAKRAKKFGRNTHQFYTSGLNAATFERMMLVSKLRRAQDRGEFSLAYQPIVYLSSGRLMGVEALLRWNNPDLGSIPPSRFIPLAEENGLIRTIGSWVLETACKQWQNWQTQNLDIGRISVNVALLQFQREDFIDIVAAALNQASMDPSSLILEVTESCIMRNPQQSLVIISKLRSMGIRLAVDDFGTGYSSLSHLKDLPIEILKLDKSFVEHLPADTGNLAITRAVLAIGKAMKLNVLVEGVETRLQHEILLREGCQYGQGFYYSHPLDAEGITNLLGKPYKRS